MALYKTTTEQPPAALTVRIRRAAAGPWQACPLLASAGGWVKVDDGQGPLWVLLDAIHPADLATVGTFDRLNLARN